MTKGRYASFGRKSKGTAVEVGKRKCPGCESDHSSDGEQHNDKKLKLQEPHPSDETKIGLDELTAASNGSDKLVSQPLELASASTVERRSNLSREATPERPLDCKSPISTTESPDRVKESRVERRKQRKEDRKYPSITHSHLNRLQSYLKIGDLQTLALYILADGTAPQWVSVKHSSAIRQVVVLLVPGLERGMFDGNIALDSPLSLDTDPASDSNIRVTSDPPSMKPLKISPDDYYPVELKRDALPAALEPLAEIFTHVWPTRAAAEQRQNQFQSLASPIDQILTALIPKSREEKELKKKQKGPLAQSAAHWKNERTPITKYVATLAEQQEAEFPVHSAWFTTPETQEAARLKHGFVESKIKSVEDPDVPELDFEKGSITAGKKVFAVDCEMVKSHDDKLILARATLLDWDGQVIFDELVKPDEPIKDYVTQYSGITEEMLENVTTTITDIQHKLVDLLDQNSILLGHSLDSDLNALKFTHPFLIDTGLLYPHVRGPPFRQSLKFLSKKYLHREIQQGSAGHSPIEDALACLDLVKQKCERGPGWGTSDTNKESIFKRLSRVTRPKEVDQYRAGAVVDWGHPNRGFGSLAQIAISCDSDEDVAKGVSLALQGQAVGKTGARQPVDFVWGRLRELEIARDWWDRATSDDVEQIREAAALRVGRPNSGDVAMAGARLGDAVSKTVRQIEQIYQNLPKCTAFVVYSGTGDPRAIRRLNQMRQQYQREYQTKKWDELSVKWTDTEVRALSDAVQKAREGIAFVTVK